MKKEKVDLIVHNAKIYTVDENFSIKQAMAIKNGKIVEVGAENQIMNKYLADKTINAKMYPIFPGFIDAHCHFLSYGFTLNELNLVGTKSFDEIIQKIKDYIKENPKKNG